MQRYVVFFLALTVFIVINCEAQSPIDIVNEFIRAGMNGNFNRLAELCCKNDGPYTTYADVKDLDLSNLAYIEKVLRVEESGIDPDLKLVVIRLKTERMFACFWVFKTSEGPKVLIGEGRFSANYLADYPVTLPRLLITVVKFYITNDYLDKALKVTRYLSGSIRNSGELRQKFTVEEINSAWEETRELLKKIYPLMGRAVLRIDVFGNVYLNENKMGSDRITVIDNLMSALKKLPKALKRKVYLEAEWRTKWGSIVELFLIFKNAGGRIYLMEADTKIEEPFEVRIPEISMVDISKAPPSKFVAPIEIPVDILGPIVLTLHRDGKVDLNMRFYELNNFQKELACIYSARQDKAIFIRAEARMPFRKVVELVDIAEGAGAATIGIISEYFEEGPEYLEIKIKKEIEPGLQKEKAKEIWIMPRVVGKLKEGSFIVKIEISPSKVKITGPASKIEDLCLVETGPIDISSWTKSGEIEANIILPAPYMKLALSQTKAKVRITISKKIPEGAVGEALPPIRATGKIKPPKLIIEVPYIYPEIARKARVEGVVNLEVTTDIYGKVVDVKVLKSIPLLDQAAIDAVKQWVYEPMIIDGKPRGVIFTAAVSFKLK